MLGVDLYAKYNLVSDWARVYADGVRIVYVKLTDGGGPAAVRGDSYVAGARAAGCSVGGYHFMQPTPSPETQADVFAAELTRLRALDVAPALDLEAATIPASSRADYARRFLLRLQTTLNVVRVALYASASWMTALAPDTWGIPGLITWDAEYGPNDSAEHAMSYRGHVNVHQFTSTGHLPGIAGAIDLDDVLTDITESGADTMAITDADLDAIAARVWNAQIPFTNNDGTVSGVKADAVLANANVYAGKAMTATQALATAVETDKAAILSAIAAIPPGTVDASVLTALRALLVALDNATASAS